MVAVKTELVSIIVYQARRGNIIAAETVEEAYLYKHDISSISLSKCRGNRHFTSLYVFRFKS
jgi:hypothetical protein